MLPEDAVLEVREILKGTNDKDLPKYDDLVESTAEKIYEKDKFGEEDTLPYARFFDITIVDKDGNAFDPEEAVSLSIDRWVTLFSRWYIDDGPRTGGLLLSSAGMSSGCLDGKEYFRLKEIDLPVWCVITDRIPYNESGKVDVHKILTNEIGGKNYITEAEYTEGRLTDIKLIETDYPPGQMKPLAKKERNTCFAVRRL